MKPKNIDKYETYQKRAKLSAYIFHSISLGISQGLAAVEIITKTYRKSRDWSLIVIIMKDFYYSELLKFWIIKKKFNSHEKDPKTAE